MRAIGLDGFRRGWVAVLIDGDMTEISFHADVASALSGQFDTAAIDIPIGMCDNGDRLCDRLARDRLHPHRSRVFVGARRWLWDLYDDPDKANREALARGQKRVSRQLWHLGPKIMEVDGFVRGHPRRNIREVHPELVFQRLNGGGPLPSKKSDEGILLRCTLLRSNGFDDIDRWLCGGRIGTGAKRDDVLDACAVAIAAHKPAGSIPEGSPPRDPLGLPMQIWF